MKSRTILCILICCALILPIAYTFAAPSVESEGGRGAVAAWEHLALPHDSAGLGGELSRQINELGTKGWQLVSVVTIDKEGTTVKTIYYFKRPK